MHVAHKLLKYGIVDGISDVHRIGLFYKNRVFVSVANWVSPFTYHFTIFHTWLIALPVAFNKYTPLGSSHASTRTLL